MDLSCAIVAMKLKESHEKGSDLLVSAFENEDVIGFSLYPAKKISM